MVVVICDVLTIMIIVSCFFLGGTFALYSVLRQHINFKGQMVMPTYRLASDVNLKFHSKRSMLKNRAREFFENNSTAQTIITFLVLLGTCMVIGDGALTPAISGTYIYIYAKSVQA